MRNNLQAIVSYHRRSHSDRPISTSRAEGCVDEIANARSCWLLFVILFTLGIMNIAAMAVITLVVLAEKTLTWGRPVARTTAAALVAYGVVVLAVPQALPTFMADDGMVSTAPATPMDMQNIAMPGSNATPARQ